MKKRILSMLLVLILCLTMLPATVLAEEYQYTVASSEPITLEAEGYTLYLDDNGNLTCTKDLSNIDKSRYVFQLERMASLVGQFDGWRPYRISINGKYISNKDYPYLDDAGLRTNGGGAFPFHVYQYGSYYKMTTEYETSKYSNYITLDPASGKVSYYPVENNQHKIVIAKPYDDPEQYRTVTYQVTIEPENSTIRSRIGANPAQSRHKIGTSVYYPNDWKRNDVVTDELGNRYIFSGWQNERSCYYPDGYSMPASDLTYYGSWLREGTVTYEWYLVEGESSTEVPDTSEAIKCFGSRPGEIKLLKGQSFQVEKYTRKTVVYNSETYFFSGWTMSNGSEDLSGQTLTMGGEDIVLTGYYGKALSAPPNPNITILFEVGTDATLEGYSQVEPDSGRYESHPAGGIAPDPGVPKRDGYCFEGWYTSAEGGEKFDFKTEVTEDITLYARWIPETVTVTFDFNGGTQLINGEYRVNTSIDVDWDKTMEAPATVPELEGYRFVGWYEKNGQGELETTAFNFDSKINSDLTLYAKYEKIACNVTVVLTQLEEKLDETPEGTIKYDTMSTSGELIQNGLDGAMQPVVLTVNDGYYFPTYYSVPATNGITVTRNSYTQITISGTPIANANGSADITITLPPADKKAPEQTPSASFVATGTDTGSLSNVDTGMQYRINDDGAWQQIDSDSVMLSGLSDGTIYVVRKGGETSLDSVPQVIPVIRVAAPQAEFHATGYDTGTLSNTEGLEYRIGSGDWQDGADSPIELSNLAPCTIEILRSGKPAALDSVQSIEITRPDAPDISFQNCVLGGDGKLIDVDDTMEYRASNTEDWIAATGSEVPGLPADSYEIRYKASGTKLASPSQRVTIGSYAAQLTDANNSIRYYDTLTNAIDAAKNNSGSTVKLLQDANIAAYSLVITGCKNPFTVDLNGKTLSTAIDAAETPGNLVFYLKQSAPLTLINSAATQATIKSQRAFHIENSGSVIIGKPDGSANDIKFELSTMLATGNSNNTGSITIYGGTFECPVNVSKTKDQGVSSVTFYGGSFRKIAVFESATLAGTLAQGYAFKQNDTWVNHLSGNTLTDVTVQKAPFKQFHVAADKQTAAYGEKITITASADLWGEEKSVAYQWYLDGTAVPDATESTYTVSNLSVADHMVRCEAVCEGYVVSDAAALTINRAAGPAALAEFTLEFALNDDGKTFTATIPAVEGAEYSFDRENYSEVNIKTDCQPNTAYTGYIRIAQTATHEAGAVTSHQQTSPKLTVAMPVFTPDGGRFSGAQNVEIACATENAVIYYTIDGSEPTTASTVYKTPLRLTGTTTVKAIAVKEDMNDSAVVTAAFTRRSGSSTGVKTDYAITVKKTANGSAAASVKQAAAGDTVTITVVPDKGYTLETLQAVDAKDKALKLTSKGNGKYIFTMPESKVVVTATFQEDNTMLNFFVDVPSDDYYYDAVLWAVENKITDGVDAVHFLPKGLCTRAQIVTFLWRAAGSPVVNYAMNLTDVPEDAYYAEAVRWALSQGITTGIGKKQFDPDAVCTRGQAMAFLYRYEKQQGGGMQGAWMFRNPFVDVNLDSYYGEAVMWGVANGITNGTSADHFSPASGCTRAQIVTFLYHYLKK